jgi:NodT family efflux transporter outer membrane factor (OMF) lipoprotein
MNTNFKSFVSVLLICISLTACAVGPDYKPPETNLAPFHNTMGAQGSHEAIALDQWWKGFNDPELVKIIERALAQNLDLQASVARVNQARAVAHGSAAQLLPTLFVDGSVTGKRQSLDGPFGSVAKSAPGFRHSYINYVVGPVASWEIDIFGGLRRGSAAADAEAQAAEADQTGTRISVAADAADAYFQIRGYQSRLDIAEQQIADDEHLLKLVHARANAGAASEREIAQAEALLKQATASIPLLRIGLERQLNRLDVLMGVQPGTYAKELKPVKDVASIPAVSSTTPVDVLRRRPDIIAAERRLAASSERIGQAISDYYPKVSLAALLGFDSLTSANLFKSAAFTAAGTGAIRWQILDFGKVDAEVAQAKGENAEALALYRQSVLRAAEDVEDSLVILQQTNLHVGEVKGQVQALLKARNLSEQAYKAGAITLTDVLDADRELLTARDELMAKRVDTARAAVGVFRALGGGWDQPQTNNK